MLAFHCSQLPPRSLFFPPNAERNFLAIPLLHRHDPILRLFRRRASNRQFASARSRDERDEIELNGRDFHEVPFDDDYCSGHDRHGDCEPRRDEMFDFVFPALHFDATQNQFFARTSHRGMRIPIAALHPNFPYSGYKLEPTAKIFLVKRSGRVTAVLNATVQPRNGARWVQIDDNWSLQNLLAFGFDRLPR